MAGPVFAQSSGAKQSDAPADAARISLSRLSRRSLAAGDHQKAAYRLRPSQVPLKSEKQAESGHANGMRPSIFPVVSDVLGSSGQTLDPALRSFMEPRFGHSFSQASTYPAQSNSEAPVIGPPDHQSERQADAQAAAVAKITETPSSGRANFSNVRIHTDSRAADSAHAVGARAYTVGNHIVFGVGEYAPQTSDGMTLLAHELAHVQQQAVSGSQVLQRQPKGEEKRTPGKKAPVAPAPKPRDPEAEVRAIVSGASAQKQLTSWLDAHPADFAVAEKFLLDKAATSTAEKEWEPLGDLLGEVFARDPGSSGARAALRDQEGYSRALFVMSTLPKTAACLHEG